MSVTSDRNVVQRDSDSGTDQKWRLKSKDEVDNSGQNSSSSDNNSSNNNSNNSNNNSSQRNTANWRYDGYGWWLEYADGSYPWSSWVKVDGTWYYFNYYGYATRGWEEIAGRWYYFDSDYSMRTGWVQSGGNWYYLASSGYMLVNTRTPDGYYVGFDGIYR